MRAELILRKGPLGPQLPALQRAGTLAQLWTECHLTWQYKHNDNVLILLNSLCRTFALSSAYIHIKRSSQLDSCSNNPFEDTILDETCNLEFRRTHSCCYIYIYISPNIWSCILKIAENRLLFIEYDDRCPIFAASRRETVANFSK